MRRQDKENVGHLQSVGSLVGKLLARRGYASVAEQDQFQQAIMQAVGESLGAELKVGKLNRGVLKVFAPDSVTVQELVFQKRQILKAIGEFVPDNRVKDVRFAVLTV
ncbi:MAG: DUF721 domain-containing protein [Planctomycetota bacterium]